MHIQVSIPTALYTYSDHISLPPRKTHEVARNLDFPEETQSPEVVAAAMSQMDSLPLQQALRSHHQITPERNVLWSASNWSFRLAVCFDTSSWILSQSEEESGRHLTLGALEDKCIPFLRGFLLSAWSD